MLEWLSDVNRRIGNCKERVTNILDIDSINDTLSSLHSLNIFDISFFWILDREIIIIRNGDGHY